MHTEAQKYGVPGNTAHDTVPHSGKYKCYTKPVKHRDPNDGRKWVAAVACARMR